MTLLQRPSNYFNKSLTRLKITFSETAQAYFLRAKFDNVLRTSFVDNPDWKLALIYFWNHLQIWHSYVGPQFIWTNPWLEWKSRIKYFFHESAASKTSSLLERTTTIKLLRRPSFHLNKSLSRLKIPFDETVQPNFFSTNFNNVCSIFYRKSAWSSLGWHHWWHTHTLLLWDQYYWPNSSIFNQKNNSFNHKRAGWYNQNHCYSHWIIIITLQPLQSKVMGTSRDIFCVYGTSNRTSFNSLLIFSSDLPPNEHVIRGLGSGHFQNQNWPHSKNDI